MCPDTYLRAGEEPTLALRSRAAYHYLGGRGVLSGYSAAELLGASCGPRDAPAEVTLAGVGRRAHPGLVVRRDRLAHGEITTCHGVRVTSPVRTAWDLARRADDLVEAVVAVDALARVAGSLRICC